MNSQAPRERRPARFTSESIELRLLTRRGGESVHHDIDRGTLIHDRAVIDAADKVTTVAAVNDGAIARGDGAEVAAHPAQTPARSPRQKSPCPGLADYRRVSMEAWVG